ncbi:hypothetical protein KDA14_01890 [Candidatus Saccharibacteria bacterium]|nr:hypothetical protein [Candidatus Saccharibacteria bacterium]
MAHADGKRVVSLSSLPEDVQAARVDLHRVTSGVVGWFNDMHGNDLFVEGMYDRYTTVELGAQGMVERVTPAPEWDRETFSGIATVAGASLQEAGSFTQDCVVELHTYPKPGETHTRTIAMPLAAMVSMDYPSSPHR